MGKKCNVFRNNRKLKVDPPPGEKAPLSLFLQQKVVVYNVLEKKCEVILKGCGKKKIIALNKHFFKERE